MRTLFEQHTLAGVIVEPIVQGAGGMRFHPPECVALLRELCDEHGILLVLDEIATGFGRTGELFAGQRRADILCLGKALTGGYMTLAATLCTAAVAERLNGPLMHGPTFMANPLATAAALASTGLLENGSWREDVARIERGLTAGLEPARDRVKDVRVKGAIGVIELDHDVDVRGRHRGRGRARRLAAAVPQSDLRDAAVRHRRRGPRADHGGDGGMRVVVTGTDTGVGKTYVSAALCTPETHLRQGGADRRRRRRADRARALRRHRPHARPLPRAALARALRRPRGPALHHAARDRRLRGATRRPRRRSRAPAACSCASARGRSPTSRSCSTRR